jgi:hypothetical protein
MRWCRSDQDEPEHDIQVVPPARTGRKGRKLSGAFVQVEAVYAVGA